MLKRGCRLASFAISFATIAAFGAPAMAAPAPQADAAQRHARVVEFWTPAQREAAIL